MNYLNNQWVLHGFIFYFCQDIYIYIRIFMLVFIIDLSNVKIIVTFEELFPIIITYTVN